LRRGISGEPYEGRLWWWDSGRGHYPEPWRGVGACFYRNVGYDGPYFCLSCGERIDHMPMDFDNTISSIQVVRAGHVVIFSKDNFGGYGGAVRDDVPNLKHWRIPKTNKSWNDRISSIRVDQGADSPAGPSRPAGKCLLALPPEKTFCFFFALC
jgi:hypothetical protein